MVEKTNALAQFGSLVLSENRIQKKTDSELQSALLSEINAIGMVYETQPNFVVLAIVFLFGGWGGSSYFPDLGFMLYVGIVAALVCLLLNFLTKKTILAVYAGRLTMQVELSGSGRKTVGQFIDAVEIAKVRYEMGRFGAIQK
jgi:hypothetical protein